MNIRTFFANDAEDSDEIRREKFAIFLVTASCVMASIIWTVLYYFVFGWGLITALPLSFFIIVGTSLVLSHLTKNHRYVIYTLILCILYIPAFVQWSIGGLFDSGIVIIWSFVAPITALMYFTIRRATVWYVLFLVNIGITIFLDDFFASQGEVVADTTKMLFFALNFVFSSSVVYRFSAHFIKTAIVGRIREEKLKQTLLRLNINIDEEQRQKGISEIVDSTFFRNLKEHKEKTRG